MDNTKTMGGGAKRQQHSSSQHMTVQKSATLNRKFVKKPVVKPQVSTRGQLAQEAMLRRQRLAEQMNRERCAALNQKRKGVVVQPVQEQIAVQAPKVVRETEIVAQAPKVVDESQNIAVAVSHPVVEVTRARVAARAVAEAPRQLSAHELKERAISRALESVATASDDAAEEVEEQMTQIISKKRHTWRKRKLVLAAGMAVASIALLGYLVHLNLPDLSVRVAAMQHGIESAYPSYIPKGYRMDGLVAEKDGKVVINFVGKDGQGFTLAEERSSWDSMALLSQFVTPEWGDDHEIIREQGLTIYVNGSDAVWVNGGVFYHLDSFGSELSKIQIHDIVVSI